MPMGEIGHASAPNGSSVIGSKAFFAALVDEFLGGGHGVLLEFWAGLQLTKNGFDVKIRLGVQGVEKAKIEQALGHGGEGLLRQPFEKRQHLLLT